MQWPFLVAICSRRTSFYQRRKWGSRGGEGKNKTWWFGKNKNWKKDFSSSSFVSICARFVVYQDDLFETHFRKKNRARFATQCLPPWLTYWIGTGPYFDVASIHRQIHRLYIGITVHFLFIFCLFQTNIKKILQQINVKICPFCIWYWYLNSRPSKHEPPPITTRPLYLLVSSPKVIKVTKKNVP